MKARIRTVDKAFDEIKAKDPETAITRYLVKQMVKQGMIPSIKSGNKRFVDVDVMEKCIDDLAGVN